ncbi:MAG: glycosyltransferase [Thermoleophilaceae bacterium]|nr:glycosyltransferase [Thermoleophilaceae bacterium]
MVDPVPDVSVVVATRDRVALLEELLASLRGQTLPRERFEVVVVDDGSRDGTAELLAGEQRDGTVRVVSTGRGEALGPAAARNAGWRAARAPVVAFTDDDCVAAPRWLEEGLAASRAAPGCIVQGRTDPRADHRPLIPAFSRTVSVTAAGPLYETCNIFYPRALLAQLEGFADGTYPGAGGEDTDLAWRALERGVRVRYAPQALVNHAVLNLGPLGMLRDARRWEHAVPVLARHPALRRAHLHRGVFWSPRHEQLVRFLLAWVVARRSRTLALLLALPYARHLAFRRSGPLLAPFLLAVDLVELAAVVRGAVRNRVLVV